MALRMLRDSLLRTQRQWEVDVWQPFCAIVEQRRSGGRQPGRTQMLWQTYSEETMWHSQAREGLYEVTVKRSQRKTTNLACGC